MKILYFISVQGHGSGGHFHSLNHISKQIGEQHKVKIISIGPGKSDIIESNPYFHKHIIFKGYNFLKLNRIIKKESKNFNPDIYHCFDAGSYNVVRFIIPSNKNKIVVNKCGGPNPKKYPYVDDIILFSIEDLEWFHSQKKFKTSNLTLIANRVNIIRLNPEYKPIIKDKNKFTFVRICRIGQFHKKSIIDSINLIEILQKKGYKQVQLIIIGVIEDNSIHNLLLQNPLTTDGIIKIFTNPEFTKGASKMLYLADAVIGTGRSVMEAASLGKPLLTINKEGEIPILLNNKYFKDAFKTNFSARNRFNKFDNNENLKNITSLINDKRYYSEISTFAYYCFEKYFDINNASEKYISVYIKAKPSKRKLITDFPLILRSFFNFYRSYSKLTKCQL